MIQRFIDLLWVVLLGAFVFAIPPTFHGDEPMQICMSHDYQTAFIDGNPSALMTAPPYYTDSEPQLRLLNGTINRYGIGLGWALAGLEVSDLPPCPGWDWAVDYDTNAGRGHIPSVALMNASRLSSTLFTALSAAVMAALGWQFGGRRMAYFVSALYTLNPIILLNGRRAVQEGSLLFFGLLLMLIAVLMARRCAERRPIPRFFWIALSVCAALSLASKYTGILFVAAAFVWVFSAIPRSGERREDLVPIAPRLAISGLSALALFVALSPALWNDPPGRILNMLQVRTNLLALQVSADPLAPMPLHQRVQEIVVQPFMSPLQHYELASWAKFQPITDDISRYMASPFSGLQFGGILGGGFTLLAGAGIVFSLRRGWRLGILWWLLVSIASLIANPLPWQRYYLPLIPVVTLLAGMGFFGLLQRFESPKGTSRRSSAGGRWPTTVTSGSQARSKTNRRKRAKR